MNYFFLDASALGKRYVVEIGTDLVNHLFNHVPTPRMLGLVLMLGEIVSILVRRRNSGHISEAAYRQAMAEFRAEILGPAGLPLESATDDLVRLSLPLIVQHSLNATDAIILSCLLQLARVMQPAGDNLVLVTADTRLAAAARTSGLLVWNPEQDNQATLDTLIAS